MRRFTLTSATRLKLIADAVAGYEKTSAESEQMDTGEAMELLAAIRATAGGKGTKRFTGQLLRWGSVR